MELLIFLVMGSWLAVNLILVVFIRARARVLPPLQRLHAWTQAHQQPLLAVTISMTAVGFVLLMGMAIHMVLARGSRCRSGRSMGSRPVA